ncbi:putative phage tail assembly chaperone [Aggregatibacter actinomycetemcomitans]|uniref:putative phage tail assembly chaperone n=1 Tax=Aggregatibacter actinomycetemcomitans TaxID=714 RepID=UPI00197BCB46|nr:putative phage tail assembly chaperone [Aggregatibacter actinomycetemcomitans]MBN6067877.1 putative phage tail assembly chaperone [Aggregatibacter actinomycetemcomitans]MBN6085814.1 putative phage tail assembly chaperone [Aggregatibacter actinomycetemcomitans]
MTEKTQAQSLLEKLTADAKNSVTIEISGTEFTFNKDAAAYDSMVNEIESGNKITPIKDYLLAIVERAQRDELLSIINVPGLALKIAGTVNKVLVPEIEITVKN